jgi:hypothetical protein
VPQGTREPPDDGLPPDAEQPPVRSTPPGPIARLAVPEAETRLTGRGAVVAMFWLFLIGLMAGDWLHLGVLAGLSFVAGCGMAARYTRRDGLLTAVASPAMIFLIALVIAEALTTHAATAGRAMTSIAEGIFLTLAGVAPWLFAGVILGLAIAMVRGLPRCVHDLAAELRGDKPGSAPATGAAKAGNRGVRPSGQGGARS